MKKNIIAAICFIALTNNIKAQTSNPSPYCEARVATKTTMFDNHIKLLIIDSLNNNSGDTSFQGSEYVYFNNISPVGFQKDIDIPGTITVSKNNRELNGCWIFIDYNINSTFEVSEFVGSVPAYQIENAELGDVNLTFTLKIPASANLGKTRMRIIYTSDYMIGDSTVPFPCNSNTVLLPPVLYYGEIEDYDINIIDLSSNIAKNTKINSAKLIVHPTFGTGVFNVDCEINSMISIYNGMGQKIMEQTSSSGKETIDLSLHSNGIYYVFEIIDNIQVVRKLIKY